MKNLFKRLFPDMTQDPRVQLAQIRIEGLANRPFWIPEIQELKYMTISTYKEA